MSATLLLPDNATDEMDEHAMTAPVVLRKRAQRRVRRSAAANAITSATPGRDDRRDSDVAVALVRSGADRQANAIARIGLVGDAVVV